ASVVLGLWGQPGHLLAMDLMQEPMLERWLSPTFAPSRELVESRGAASGTFWEWLLMFASIGVAFAGWLIARAFYKDAKSTVPENLAAAFSGFCLVVYHK